LRAVAALSIKAATDRKIVNWRDHHTRKRQKREEFAEALRRYRKGAEVASSSSESDDGWQKRRVRRRAEWERGDEVYVVYPGLHKGHLGIVVRVRSDGTYDVEYEDGDRESSLPSNFLRPAPIRKSPSSRNFRRGDRVEVKSIRSQKWFKAELIKAHRDGTFDVEYEDGDKETNVDAELIRSLEAPKKADTAEEAKGSDKGKGKGASLEVGDKVEARFRGRSKWFKGTIRKAHRDGTFDVEYEDGDKETNVDAELIRSLEAPKKDEGSPDKGKGKGASLEVGDKVEARFRGRSKWFKGTILKAHRDGTFDVEYEDGDKETNVDAELIRSLEAPKKDEGSPDKGKGKGTSLEVGDKVEARFRGRSKWFKGTILKAHRDGTFDVKYEDGDKETNVDAELIRSLEAPKKDEGSPDKGKGKGASLEVGDKVEARFRGRSKWFKGTILKAHRDGTFDVEYEDGDKETNVDAELIRSLEAPKKEAEEAKGSDKGKGKGASLEVGDKVEARFRGRSKWFKGTIRKAHRDGTFDVEYEDGDKETNVDAELIRSLEAPKKDEGSPDKGKGKGASLEVGDKVEARFRGRSKWFKGTILKAHRDGTFDVEYEDGDKETNVDAELIRSLEAPKKEAEEAKGSDKGKGKGASLEVGDKVEARFRGRSKWFKGTILKAHRDGTFDVEYEDGDKETNVDAELIRSLEAPKKDEGSPDKGKGKGASLEVGDKVEARFRGRSKWFKGTIRKAHRDGTFDVEYEDGDKETNVDAELIRSLEAPKKDEGSPDKGKGKGASLEVGDKVEARFRGRSKWFKGTILKAHRDGTFDVEYEDGDKETNVDAELIRSLEAPKKERSPRRAKGRVGRSGSRARSARRIAVRPSR
jgi:chloramphenicol 3-O-phosphotransferase